MKFSRKCDYALLVILDLSNFYNGDRVHISDIANRRNIPSKFLEQILLLLKKGGLVQSKRGPNGGYFLNRPPQEIMVGEVIRIVEKTILNEHIDDIDSQDKTDIVGGNGFFGLYKEIEEAICNVIDNISFAEIRDREEESLNTDQSGFTYCI